MQNRTLRSTKLSARAAYAQNRVEEQSQKRGRGRPKVNPVPPTVSLSKAAKNTKTTLRKRRQTSGGGVVKKENNSSEADCSSEGEEQVNVDDGEEDVGEQHSDENSENEDKHDNSSVENSVSNKESEQDIFFDADKKSESGGLSVKSTGEEDENEIRYSLPNINQQNILESSKKQTMNKKDKRISRQKTLSSDRRKAKGSYQTSSSAPRSFKPDFKNQKFSAVEYHSNQDGESAASTSEAKVMQRYNRNISKSKKIKDKKISHHILREIIGKYEDLKRKYKRKRKGHISNDDNSAKRFRMEKRNIPTGDQPFKTLSYSHRFKSINTRYSLGKIEPLSLSDSNKSSLLCGNVAAEEAFRWLLNPMEPEEFFVNIYEQMPYHISRKKHYYFKELFNCDNLNTLLKENDLMYGVHIDVLKYENGERKPVEAVGKAYNSNVWDDFKQGYSIRLRNPQAYNKNIWNFCSLLQEYFSSSVGCNVYLTPPDSQGFPPHYDDIDAFIVQVEGAKLWKIYPPRNANEELARYSSTDFQQNEIGQPMLEIFLSPGDMLYIPRGYIHQACTGSLEHSLHLTFSTNQLNTWGDLMLQATQKAIEKAILNEVEFRKAVPRDFMDCAGSSLYSEDHDNKKSSFLYQIGTLARMAFKYLDANDAVDAHAQRFIRCSLPPVFNKVERQCSIHGNGTQWKDGEIISKNPIDLNTEIRLIRKRNLRLIIDDSGPKLYHSLENKRDPASPDSDSQEIVYIDFDIAGVQPFTYLLETHSRFVKVSDLPMDDIENRVVFATSLYENGVLMTKEPLTDSKETDWNTLLDNDINNMKKEKSFLNM